MLAHVLSDHSTLERSPQFHPKEKPPDPGKFAYIKDRKSLERAKKEIAQNLSDIRLFGRRFGFPPVFGDAPKPEELKTAKQIRHEDRLEMKEQYQQFLQEFAGDSEISNQLENTVEPASEADARRAVREYQEIPLPLPTS